MAFIEPQRLIELLTKDKPIAANQKVCLSVSRRRLLCAMDQGNLMEREMSTNQLGLVPTRKTYSAHSKFSEITQAGKDVDGSGKLDERNSSNAQIRGFT